MGRVERSLLVYFYSLEEVVWNQKFGCLQHARHTPVPLHNSQSAMALLHGYPLGLFDHPKWTSQVRDEQAFAGAYRMAQSGEQVTGSIPGSHRNPRRRGRARWPSTRVGREGPAQRYATKQEPEEAEEHNASLSLFIFFSLLRTVRSQ